MKNITRLVWLSTAVTFAPAVFAQGTMQQPPGYYPYSDQSSHNTAVAIGSPTSSVGAASADTFDLGAQMSIADATQAFSPSEPPSATPTTTESAAGSATGSTVVQVAAPQQIDIEAGGGSFEVNGQKADIYTLKVPYSQKLSERGTLQLSLPVSIAVYKNVLNPATFQIVDAKAYGVGLNAGYAWQVFTKQDNVPYRCKITPSAGLFYRDSADLRQGAFVFNSGFSSSLAWQYSPGWVLNLGNSVSLAWNSGIKGYPDPVRDNQQTLSNGLQIFRMLGRWTYYGYVIDTEALCDVLVDSYQSYAIGAAYQLTKSRSLRATLNYDQGNAGYKSLSVKLGTGWQF